jgi:hypothetical protein
MTSLREHNVAFKVCVRSQNNYEKLNYSILSLIILSMYEIPIRLTTLGEVVYLKTNIFSHNTACLFDIRLHWAPLGQARQFIETCGTLNPLCGG